MGPNILTCGYCEVRYWENERHECSPDHMKERIEELHSEVCELREELNEAYQ